MGRLDGVGSLNLPLPNLCADFYLLEMATVHIPNGPASAVFERFQAEIAPKIALTLEYSISTELGFAKGILKGPLQAIDGGNCPHCGADQDGGYVYQCASKWDEGCGVDHNFLYCGDCETHFMPGETIEPDKRKNKYPQSVVDFCGLKGKGYYNFTNRYNEIFEKYGPQFHVDISEAFHKGVWTPGYGGKKWGTIADVVRDYWFGNIKPRTFLDRAWTLQHNNASVFDKIYSVGRLMTVLEVQASNDYRKLSTYASPHVSHLWRRMESWVGVYTMDTTYGRRVPEWIGTGD